MSEVSYYEEMAKYIRTLKWKWKFATIFGENEIVVVVDNSWLSLRFDENDRHLIRIKIALEDIAMFECTPVYILYTHLKNEEAVGTSFKPTPQTTDVIIARDLQEAKEFVETVIQLLRENVQKANEYLKELAQIYESALSESEEA